MNFLKVVILILLMVDTGYLFYLISTKTIKRIDIKSKSLIDKIGLFLFLISKIAMLIIVIFLSLEVLAVIIAILVYSFMLYRHMQWIKKVV